MAMILLVDDDVVILKVAKAILAKGGHNVIFAKNGHEALDIANAEIVDLIISDANMPGGVSGFNLVSTLRKHEKYQSTPIIFLTGRRDKADIARALESGVDDYIVKPIDETIFLAKVEALLLSRRGPHSFSQTPVHKPGVLAVALNIIFLSEQGLSFESSMEMPADTKFRIDTPLWDELGFEAPLLRVINCTAKDASKKLYMINVSFVGLTEADHQKIRQWVMSNNLTKSKVS